VTEAMTLARSALAAWRATSSEAQAAWFSARHCETRPPFPDGKIRVGLLGPCLCNGGAEAMQLAMARYADPDRIAWVGCCATEGPDAVAPEMMAVTSALLPVSAGIDAARQLAAQCDVLVTWAIEGIDNLLAGLAGPPKIISVCHSPIESPWGIRVYARAAADRFVAVSELALPVIPAESHPATPIIWNAVDRERMTVRRDRATMRAAWGVPESAPVAGYLGRLSAEKDPLAMARLAAALPEPWRVVVVGSGAERLDLVAPPNLIMPGPDPAAGDVLNAFDVLVVPSHYESFGLTLAEGIAARLPVVSTEVGLAKLAPGITRLIPTAAAGWTLAEAVLRAFAEGPRPAAADLIPKLLPGRFGCEWDGLLAEVVGDPPRSTPPIDSRLAMLADLCPHASGPCGCGSGPPRICGHPDHPPEVRRAGCLECVARSWWESGSDPAS
jgi:hypothetical protein